MAKLVLTAKERVSANYLSWDDQALGRAVKKLALDIADHYGDEAMALTVCATMLASASTQRGAGRTEIDLMGVTDGTEELGDWTVVITRSATIK